MLNRPRLRKIVTVVKSESNLKTTDSDEDKRNEYVFIEPETEKLAEPQPLAPKQAQFMPRKPALTTLKKANIPPPPSYSEVRSPTSSKGPSPTQSPTKAQTLPARPSEGFDKIALSFAEDLQQIEGNNPSPSSAGEKFLEAADKAADYIGGTFLGQFNKLSLAKSPSISNDLFDDIMTGLKPSNSEQTFQDLLCSSASDSFSEIARTASSRSPTKSPITSPESTSSQGSGFRASIMKHGLTALEKIGKTTADVVTSTRNKIIDTNQTDQTFLTARTLPVFEPDFFDSKSSFYEVFQQYAGHAKLTDLQLLSVKASISMKLKIKSFSKKPSKASIFDLNARKQCQARIAKNLHPDRILEIMTNGGPENILLYDKIDFYNALRSFEPLEDWFDIEIDCLKRLLRSLDSIFVDESNELEACNRRRHLLCQIIVFWCDTLKTILSSASSHKFDFISLSCDIATLSAHLLKCLQKSFESCSNDSEQANSDNVTATKLLIEISYTSVPIIQSFVFSGLN